MSKKNRTYSIVQYWKSEHILIYKAKIRSAKNKLRFMQTVK